MPAVLFGRVEGFSELPGGHAAGTEIANFAGTHERIERLQCFFDRSCVVPAMNLVEVNVVHLKTAQRIFAGFDDMFTTQSSGDRPTRDPAVDFGWDDDVIT